MKRQRKSDFKEDLSQTRDCDVVTLTKLRFVSRLSQFESIDSNKLLPQKSIFIIDKNSRLQMSNVKCVTV